VTCPVLCILTGPLKSEFQTLLPYLRSFAASPRSTPIPVGNTQTPEERHIPKETIMTNLDLNWTPSRRSLEHHDHTITLLLDAPDWYRFRSFADDSDDIVILNAKLDADRVVVRCGCQSAEICDLLYDAWG
jgi:hypothetical protein